MYTNTTPNYNLPVFLGGDKPVWQDVSTGNELVDTALHDLQDALTTAEGVGTGNTQAITALQDALKTANDIISKQGVDLTQAQADILANAGNITKLQGDYNTLNSTVDGHETRLTAAEGEITQLDSSVATNTSNINSLLPFIVLTASKTLSSSAGNANIPAASLGLDGNEPKGVIITADIPLPGNVDYSVTTTMFANTGSLQDNKQVPIVFVAGTQLTVAGSLEFRGFVGGINIIPHWNTTELNRPDITIRAYRFYLTT